MVEAVDEQALDVGPACDGDDVVAATGRRLRYPSWSWSVMIMRWPYRKVLMFSAVYFVPKRRPRILTTFWTCVWVRSGSRTDDKRLHSPADDNGEPSLEFKP